MSATEESEAHHSQPNSEFINIPIYAWRTGGEEGHLLGVGVVHYSLGEDGRAHSNEEGRGQPLPRIKNHPSL